MNAGDVIAGIQGIGAKAGGEREKEEDEKGWISLSVSMSSFYPVHCVWIGLLCMQRAVSKNTALPQNCYRMNLNHHMSGSQFK